MSTTSATSPALPRPSRRVQRLIDGLSLILLIAATWQIMSWLLGELVLPSLPATLRTLAELFASDDFNLHVWETLSAFGLALAIAVVSGICIGLLLGANPLAGDVFEPLLMAVYSVPKIVLYPVVLLLFGLGMSSKVAFGVLHGVIPIAIFTMTAVRQIRPVYLRLARTLRMPWPRMAWRVLAPAARPEILSGLRIGFSLTLLGTLIGEMFASRYGLGYLLMHAIERNQPQVIMALSLVLFTFAIAANMLLLALDRKYRHD